MGGEKLWTNVRPVATDVGSSVPGCGTVMPGSGHGLDTTADAACKLPTNTVPRCMSHLGVESSMAQPSRVEFPGSGAGELVTPISPSDRISSGAVIC
ncbi:hypothetical protein V6N12_000277 [Hibiscus sabdariffa]|uniref:Uncharacterized protein n=1 Tax=Hibiscus sabdariffa TaxID=183260 RepID=A0ABR1ZZ62_9ROSI